MKPANKSVLEFLRLRGRDGATEAEIQAATAIRSGGQRVHELRRSGYRIETVRESSPIGSFARWYLIEARPVMTGTQMPLLGETR
jgi:hypothetical protein